ncbi:hypothetical protein Q31b_36730 [Novipirellula aureliae]|uniref:YcxB-like protein domain-containing protein n=1 Tax=Novipirellula aureliae TaxID=2527966 RepID=A0A5C6DVF7_9BACT|nr:hypothetical protein [Novipirellula aureliae]TWU40325.1 hypothetical protein Q31b_36730 [Novipirellula aureliae]
MNEDASKTVNPYLPPSEFSESKLADQDKPDVPPSSVMKISGTSTREEMIHTLGKPVQVMSTLFFGSVLIAMQLFNLFNLFPTNWHSLESWVASVFFLLVTAGIVYGTVLRNSGKHRAERMIHRSPWLGDSVHGNYDGTAIELHYSGIRFWAALISGRSEVNSSGYKDQLWGYPIIVTASQFEDAHWWRRLSIRRSALIQIQPPLVSNDVEEATLNRVPNGLRVAAERGALPKRFNDGYRSVAYRIGTWKHSLLSGNANRLGMAVRVILGTIALVPGVWLLWMAWDLYCSTTWTPYWTAHYNRVAPPLWAGGGIATLVGLILVMPAIVGIWLNRRNAPFGDATSKATAMLICDQFVFLQQDSTAVQCDWSHIRHVRGNRYGLIFQFNNRYRFFVPRIAFASCDEFSKACRHVEQVFSSPN